jgi:predicted phage terminase large subunit-like protein
LLELERDVFRKSFRDFVPNAFEIVETGDARAAAVRSKRAPRRYVPGWHIDVIAEHLQAVADGQIERLLINVPPGTTKSMLACVLWPAWLWGTRDAALRMIFSSYSETFTKRDTRKTKALLQSVWYRERFPHVVLKRDPDTSMEHHTTVGGERQGASTNSGVTGKHIHGCVEDDPLKAQDAMSERAREEAWHYRTQVLGTRLLPEAGWRVLIMQRLHEDDPSGRILAAQAAEEGGYMHLCLPMEFEPKKRCVTSISRDPREREGELLWPARMGEKFVAEKKSPVTGLGEFGYAGQYQQRPAPAEGGIIKRAWIRHYDKLPDAAKVVLQAWDLTFKLTGTSWIVGQTWAAEGAKFYLVDQVRERLDFVGAKKLMRAFWEKWRETNRSGRLDKLEVVSVEDAANGPAIVSDLRDTIPGLVLWAHGGKSKIERLAAVSPLYEAGQVFYPHPSIAPWIEAHIEELVTFPNATNDDQVDTATQSLDRLKARVANNIAITLNLAVGRKSGVLQL